jgi:PncC family amidohydrolase
MICVMKERIESLAVEAISLMRARGLSFAAAESCTGGMLASSITSVPGCSDVMMGAVVAYDNCVKQVVLGVSSATLEKFGAVSEETVREMVQGVACRLGADCALATSGIAGPGGGSDEKPVGTVWVAVNVCGEISTLLLRMNDKGREHNMNAAVEEALRLLVDRLSIL